MFNRPIKVSIMPRGKSALGFSQCEVSETKLKNRDELLERMCVLLGGRVAEELYFENVTTGASDDIKKLTDLAYQFVGNFAMGRQIPGTFYYNRKNRYYSEATREKVDTRSKTNNQILL